MLFRWYGFEAAELFETQSDLDADLDPKTAWALRHPERFPVELMSAELPRLLRVPGIGPRSAQRILALRKSGNLTYTSLRKLKIRTRYAAWFITVRGAMMPDELFGGPVPGAPKGLDDLEGLRDILRDKKPPPRQTPPQFDFFT
jgi:predicted DNA-binding helix-hairpin-helix protein